MQSLKTVIFFTSLFFTSFAVNATAPCWFWSPVKDDKIGFVGAASPFSVKKEGSKLASRQRALLAFSDYYQVEIANITEQEILNEKLSIEQYQIHFSAPFVSDLGLFSYALVTENQHNSDSDEIKAWLNSECKATHCDFNACEPSWLCDSDSSHVFGVSQMTSTPSMQLARMKTNAQMIAEYLQQSNVEEEVKRIQSTGKYQNWGLQGRKSQVDATGHALPLLNSKICAAKNYVFGLFDTPSEASNTSGKGFEKWLKEPGMDDKAGVVGSFDGLTADGLFSTSVKYAIKDGLIQLAKIKHVNIDHEFQLTFTNGWYTLSKSTESTSATVSGTLMDLKVVEEDKRLVIYAWLIEN